VRVIGNVKVSPMTDKGRSIVAKVRPTVVHIGCWTPSVKQVLVTAVITPKSVFVPPYTSRPPFQSGHWSVFKYEAQPESSGKRANTNSVKRRRLICRLLHIPRIQSSGDRENDGPFVSWEWAAKIVGGSSA
jgi:hypothetical protein